eukprot:g2768.t1
MVARHSGGVGGASAAWRCYSPETLDSARDHYVSGTCYCTRDAEIAAVLERCANPPAFAPVDVFTSGADGYHTYRIPSLVTATNGDFLLFAEGRKESSSDHDWNDIVLKRSSDNGKTWGPMQIVYSESSAAKHVTIGNPAPVVVQSTPGAVVLLACRENKAVLRLRSADHGRTWESNATDVSAQVMDSSWPWIATGPPGGMQLASGRLIVAADHYLAGGTQWGSHVLYSDDEGDSWQRGASLDGPGGGNECQAATAPNGSLILNMRTRAGFRQFSWSNDNGTTWTEPTAAPMAFKGKYGGGSCEGSTVQVGNALAFSTPYSAGRANMTVLTSTDSGATWQPRVLVDAGAAAYSSMQPVNATHAALVYERGGYAALTVVVVQVADAAGAQP